MGEWVNRQQRHSPFGSIDSPIHRFTNAPGFLSRPLAAEAGVFLAYILLTVVMTYPVAFRLSATEDPGDPLFIAWTIFWVQHQLFTDPLHLFDANIFFPYPKTLAFSEHMIGSALLALPMRLFTDDPIVVYNLLAILTFILSGWGTYRLAFHLTGNRWAAFIAGAIFAFTPFRTYQFGHLHVMNTQWVPFAVLSLIRVFETRGAFRHVAGLTGFTLLQILSSGSHAPFFVVIMVGVGAALIAGEVRILADARFLSRVLTAVLLVVVFVAPFWQTYRSIKNEYAFRADPPLQYFSAVPIHYLAAPPKNRLYAPLTWRLGHYESHLFPGLVPIFGGMLAFLPRKRRSERDAAVYMASGSQKAAGRKDALLLLDLAVLMSFLVLVLVTFFGEIHLVLGLRVSLKSLWPAWITLLVLLAVRWLIGRGRPFLQRFVLDGRFPITWLLLLLLAISLSYGPYGPGRSLYSHAVSVLPGMEFLRVPARIGIFVPFFLAVLSSFSIVRLSRYASSRLVLLGVLLLVLVESASVPLASGSVPVRPHIYDLLGKLSGPGAMARWPMARDEKGMGDLLPQYYSIAHWRPLLYGYSGFRPPGYYVVKDALEKFPDEESMRFLRELGVRFVVVDGEVVSREEGDRVVREVEENPRLTFRSRDGPVALYELVSAPPAHSAETADAGGEISRKEWKVSASDNTTPTEAAIDGRRETTWDSGHPQRPGDFFQVDLGRPYNLSMIEIPMGASVGEFPRGLQILVSDDGIKWRTVVVRNSPLAEYLMQAARMPRDVWFRVTFSPVEARFLRLEVTRSDRAFAWRIPELRLYH